jgi:hypothetical protein
MFFFTQGLVRFSLGVSIAAYIAGILLAGTVTALGSYRVISAILSELGPDTPAVPVATAPYRPQQISSASPPPAMVAGRQAFMTPLRAGGPVNLPRSTASAPRDVVPAFFGSSSRYWGRPTRRDRDPDDEDDDDDGERPQAAGTYRTLCVRLCDGYYFPISFSATRDRLACDAKTCENSCGAQARLFIYSNPGADVEDMVDLRGQPYKQLSTAFLYRTEYVPQCRCKPNPWDAEAQERHRMYALAAAKRKGSKQAAAELDALTAKMKLDRSAQPAQVAMPAEASATMAVDTGKTRGADRTRRSDRGDDKNGRMGLGARTPRESRERPSRVSGRDSDWMRRALGQPN